MYLRRRLACLACLACSALALPPSARAGGLTLRLGVGPGYAAGSHDTDGASATGGGIAVNTELEIGTELRPGLIVGGGTFPMVVPSPAYADQDAGGHHMSATGPFVDYYPRPPRGLHVEGGLLLVAGYHEAQMSHASAIGLGAGAVAGVGYDLRLGGRWSLGPLVRATYYHWSGGDYRFDLVATSALVALTRH
jgi:hypothetical protein